MVALSGGVYYGDVGEEGLYTILERSPSLQFELFDFLTTLQGFQVNLFELKKKFSYYNLFDNCALSTCQSHFRNVTILK